MPEILLKKRRMETGIYTGFAVQLASFISKDKPQNTYVNARKNSELKSRTALAFTPGYAVNLIACIQETNRITHYSAQMLKITPKGSWM
jgi:hypothetical protein